MRTTGREREASAKDTREKNRGITSSDIALSPGYIL